MTPVWCFICRFTNWEHKHVNPEGEVIESLGPADDPSGDTLAVVRHYNLPDAFPESVVREAETVSALVDEPGEREDLRDAYILTVDPARARDFDDALSLESQKDGSRVLGVHIADVSHFVRPGSELDAEAARRGNSVYLPDTVLPMLPEQLSNGVCSLRPDEDRLAFSAFLTLDANDRIVKSRFARTIIRSRLRLTYEQALAVLEDRPGDAGMDVPKRAAGLLKALHAIAQNLRRARFERHALDLDMPECEIVMGKNGRVEKIHLVRNDVSHQLIEECMVAANEAVARELRVNQVPLISRLHEPSNVEKIGDLTAQLAGMGFEPGDLTQQSNLAAFLRRVADDPLVMHIRMAVLRSLSRAVYSAEESGHYGLAKTDYCHFTSPIRRYPDLTVHRQLAARLSRGDAQAGRRTMYGRDDLSAIASVCTATEEAADEAERTLEEIKKYRYLEQQIADQKVEAYDAVVVTVLNFGMFVEVLQLRIQGLIHVSEISDRFVRYDSGSQSLNAGNTVYRVGSELQVIPVRVDFDKRQIDFVIAGEGKPGDGRPKGGGSRGGEPRGGGNRGGGGRRRKDTTSGGGAQAKPQPKGQSGAKRGQTRPARGKRGKGGSRRRG